MNRKPVIVALFLITFLSFAAGYPQQTAVYSDPDRDLKEGLELFHKAQYGAALMRFTDYLRRTEGSEATSRSDAAFYRAMCAIRLEHANGEALVNTFLKDYPESSKATTASYEMGKVLFMDKKIKSALRWFKQVIPGKLPRELLPDFNFSYGYCLFDGGDFKAAQPLFRQAMQPVSPVSEPASYYYYYTLYQSGNYDEALKGFLSLRESREFGQSANMCIAQIYYYRGRFEEVTSMATNLIRSAKGEQQTELARIIGDSYFRLDRFTEAIPYLEQYRKGVKSMSREEHYSLGYAYYQNSQPGEAVKELEQVSDMNDELSQYSAHLLGGILVDLNDKLKARSAFRKAANLTFDKKLQEESLLNYAKLNFDLSISGETLRAFEEFLRTFPESRYQEQVYDYLVQVFMNTRNYQEALVTLDKISNKTPDVRKASQRIAYYRGLELFNNLKYGEAIEMLDRSLDEGAWDDHIRALCYYWQAEAWYNTKAYQKAISCYERFLSVNGVQDLPEHNLAYYGIAYSHFNLDNYEEAQSWFRRFISRAGRQDRLLADAYNRMGDCLFMSRTYYQAIDFYDKALALKTNDASYALFQKGFSLGLVQRPAQKIEALNRLIRDYPKSQYLDDALFEIGRSYVDLNQTTQAIGTFQDLIRKYPGSSYVRKSHIQLGLIFYNSNRNEQALAQYKKVISDWPDSQEAADAMAGIKNIFIEENRVDDYLAYVQSTGRASEISASEQDSLIYQAAETLYLQGNCERSKQSFDQYITRFPQGHFLLNAYYYKADCHFRANELNAALSAYSFILARGTNSYTEVALARSAEICYQQSNFERARVLYRQLEQQADAQENILDARIGIMRCAYRQQEYQTVIQYASQVLGSDRLPEELSREASFILGKSYLEQGDADRAADVLARVASDVKNKEGAEAKYLIAQIRYDKGEIDLSEQGILEFLDQNTTHQYWLAKAYILWSDIYVKRQDLFQAKATLDILKENYTRQDDGILETVNTKLNWIANQTREN